MVQPSSLSLPTPTATIDSCNKSSYRFWLLVRSPLWNEFLLAGTRLTDPHARQGKPVCIVFFVHNIYMHVYIFCRAIDVVLQTDEQDVIQFLLTTEIIPLCLRIMESGSELSKTVATFILQKILLDETGLSYVCQTYERFSHVAMILVGLLGIAFILTFIIQVNHPVECQ